MSLISKRKGQFLFAGFLLLLAVGAFFLWRPLDPGPEPEEKPSLKLDPDSSVSIPLPSQKLRRHVDNDHKEIEKSETAPAPQNTPSPAWQESLEGALLKQGGTGLKDLEITPIESLIWVHEGKSLNVETARIQFKDPNGRQVSFKAMVDSQTGKVLQTWDQPVIDDFSGKEKSGIKLDPRYLDQ